MADRIGKLRHFITIEEFVRTTTGSRGQEKGSWQPRYQSVSASIEQLAGREVELARQIVATATHRIAIRYHSDIHEQQRAIWNDRVFNIGSVADTEERNIWLILTCTEEKPA